MRPLMFAKLYNTSVGQVLIKKDLDREGNPEVRFYFETSELGVCSIAYSFKDTERGRMECKSLFHDSNELQAEGIAVDASAKVRDTIDGND